MRLFEILPHFQANKFASHGFMVLAEDTSLLGQRKRTLLLTINGSKDICTYAGSLSSSSPLSNVETASDAWICSRQVIGEGARGLREFKSFVVGIPPEVFQCAHRHSARRAWQLFLINSDSSKKIWFIVSSGRGVWKTRQGFLCARNYAKHFMVYYHKDSVSQAFLFPFYG